VLLKAVKRWVGEGRKATLVGAPDEDILLEAIEELRKRTTAESRRATARLDEDQQKRRCARTGIV